MRTRLGLGWILMAAALFAAKTMAAQGWEIGPWVRAAQGPVIEPDKTASFTDPISKQKTYWEALHTFNPAATIAPDGRVAVVFRAEDASGMAEIGGHTSRLGLATSANGTQFQVRPAPVLTMANDAQRGNEYPGGVEDPRIVTAPDGTYVMTYTQYPRGNGPYRVGVATSKDLETWTKWGPAFGTGNGYDTLPYKSAGILTELRGGRLTAVKLQGRYWMYWGEIQVRLATSEDLIHWTPVVDAATKQPKVVLAARAGHFDSGFPEVGPPPVLTKRGVVLLYNGKNSNGKNSNGKNSTGKDGEEALAGDPEIAAGAYSVGEALFSAEEPGKLLERTEKPVLTPVMPYERSGQYVAGTTFSEGLVAFGGQWLLYYGAADSRVGVARAERSR